MNLNTVLAELLCVPQGQRIEASLTLNPDNTRTINSTTKFNDVTYNSQLVYNHIQPFVDHLQYGLGYKNLVIKATGNLVKFRDGDLNKLIIKFNVNRNNLTNIKYLNKLGELKSVDYLDEVYNLLP